MTIDTVAVYEGEAMLYLYQTYVAFESHGGSDVWLIEDFSGGKSAGEVAKQGASDNLIRAKVLADRAVTMGVVIDEETRGEIETNAASYFETLPEPLVVAADISTDTVERVLEDAYLGLQVMEATTVGYEPTLADITNHMLANEEYKRLLELEGVDILTSYRVQHLVIRTHVQDDNRQWTPLPEEEQEQAYMLVTDLHQMLDGGESFVSILKAFGDLNYYEDQPEGIIYNKAQLPPEFSVALDDLEAGQFTEVIEGRTGYHILYLEEKHLPTEEELFDYQEQFGAWEASLRAEAVGALNQEAFDAIYSRWKEELSVDYGEDWLNVTIETMVDILEGEAEASD